MTDRDELYLRRTIKLALEARSAGNMPDASLLVGPDGQILAEEYNTVVTERDICAHPELKLAQWAARELEADVARATTLYTNCEPCTMCAGAIARSGLGRVVFALSLEQWEQIKAPGAISPDATQVQTEGPALFDEARIPFDGWVDRPISRGASQHA